MTKTICVDFDGVLHSYVSGWQGFDVISDPPVMGAFDWLSCLIADDRFRVCVYSSRSAHRSGIEAMKRWFAKHGLAKDEIDGIEFPEKKPPAWITLDDRAICFEGVFPTADEVDNFLPWYQKPEVAMRDFDYSFQDRDLRRIAFLFNVVATGLREKDTIYEGATLRLLREARNAAITAYANKYGVDLFAPSAKLDAEITITPKKEDS